LDRSSSSSGFSDGVRREASGREAAGHVAQQLGVQHAWGHRELHLERRRR
jgi:hypothetical protein